MLKDLLLQMQYFPEDKRLACLTRAEKLHDSIQLEELYPQDYLTYRITGVPAVNQSETLYLGEAVQPDLRQMIDHMSRQLKLVYEPDKGIQMWTERDLANKFDVSAKTIRRWRTHGLRWRHMKHARTGRHENRYPADTVMQFMIDHRERIEAGRRFSRMDDQKVAENQEKKGSFKRADIPPRARDIILGSPETEWTIFRMAKRLSEETGRTVETIRLILVEHEKKCSDDQRLFAKKPGTVKPHIRNEIFEAWRQGTKVTELTRRYERSRSSIHRFIREERAERLRQRPMQLFTSPLFDREDAGVVLLREETHPEVILKELTNDVQDLSPLLLPDELIPIIAPADLTVEQEHALLVRLHYLIFLFKRETEGLPATNPSGTKLNQLDERLIEINKIRSVLFINAMRALWRLMSHSEPDHCQPGRIHKTFMDSLLSGAEELVNKIDSFDPWQGRNARNEMRPGTQTNTSLTKHFIWKQMRRIAVHPAGQQVKSGDETKARAFKRMSKNEIYHHIKELRDRHELILIEI